jgi:hypothetical protein
MASERSELPMTGVPQLCPSSLYSGYPCVGDLIKPDS